MALVRRRSWKRQLISYIDYLKIKKTRSEILSEAPRGGQRGPRPTKTTRTTPEGNFVVH